jgi:hypothetical protein
LTGLTGVGQRSDRSGLLDRLWPITESDQLAFLYKPNQPLLTMVIWSMWLSWSSWQNLYLGALELTIWHHIDASPKYFFALFMESYSEPPRWLSCPIKCISKPN